MFIYSIQYIYIKYSKELNKKLYKNYYDLEITQYIFKFLI